MDECIEIIKGLTTGEYFEFHGEFYDIPKTRMTPAPTKPIPILVGGHADAALRRAARCDGWMHGGGAPRNSIGLSPGSQIRDEEGRTGPFEIHVISLDAFTLDGIKRLEDKESPTSSSGSGFPTLWDRTASRWIAQPQARTIRGERDRQGVATSRRRVAYPWRG